MRKRRATVEAPSFSLAVAPAHRRRRSHAQASLHVLAEDGLPVAHPFPSHRAQAQEPRVRDRRKCHAKGMWHELGARLRAVLGVDPLALVLPAGRGRDLFDELLRGGVRHLARIST
ncbi:hypothetical protein QYE76_053837 [Lolium multiflorum]|uniref:Uncharacterized protein n=1 Tax=Lolium multiflorum TaxID=4521 RepID=A0AAD8WMC7_LOLMU|nr:hypothetical protein QYE76_053837 [Lolium multiflorum]